MCQINNVLLNTGNKPLICYKVLFRDSISIRSPYFSSCLWELGETKHSKQSHFYGDYIGSGFFHAFIDRLDAYHEQIGWRKMYLEWLKRHPSNDYIIVKMEIPPYTDYYTGMTEDGIDSIATPVITFKQIL